MADTEVTRDEIYTLPAEGVRSAVGSANRKWNRCDHEPQTGRVFHEEGRRGRVSHVTKVRKVASLVWSAALYVRTSVKKERSRKEERKKGVRGVGQAVRAARTARTWEMFR